MYKKHLNEIKISKHLLYHKRDFLLVAIDTELEQHIFFTFIKIQIKKTGILPIHQPHKYEITEIIYNQNLIHFEKKDDIENTLLSKQ
jgi:hypothetical protein